jgi:hypothetical protein
MKKDSDEQKFLADLLAGPGDLRSATLSHGLALSRRKRHRRRVVRGGLFFLPLLVVTMLFWQREHKVSSPPEISISRVANSHVQTEHSVERSAVHLLTDAELLDLFKGHPVALVGRPGKQTLIVFDEKPN